MNMWPIPANISPTATNSVGFRYLSSALPQRNDWVPALAIIPTVAISVTSVVERPKDLR